MGQPVVLRLPSPGGGEVPAVFCISGQLVRVSDGKLLAEGIGTFRACANICSDGREIIVAHNAGTGGNHAPLPGRRWSETGTTPAVRFRPRCGATPAPSGDSAEAELVWQEKLRLGAYPIVLGGRIVTESGNVLALADGKTVSPGKKGGGIAYNGMILAGGHLFGQPQFRKMEAQRGGNTVAVRVAKLGEKVEVLGDRPLETGDPAADPDKARREKIIAQTGDPRWRSWYGWHEAYAAPFASGNRLFCRTFDHLYCFGDRARPFAPSKAFDEGD
jgi:hypothetical protein